MRRPLLIVLPILAALVAPQTMAQSVAQSVAQSMAQVPDRGSSRSAVPAATESHDSNFVTDDGLSLTVTVSGQAPLRPRPTIVEFSPYGAGTGSLDAGPAYNYLLVQDRGTGSSGGEFDALGPRAQRDVVEVLRWACQRPWSDGRLAVNGFSASAIMLFNSLHLRFPGCVKAMVTRSGTFELYRDLLVPGGVMNLVPGAGVLALIGYPATTGAIGSGAITPADQLPRAAALMFAGLNAGLLHPTLDSWWSQRGFRGDVNHLPVLEIDGFFDVESRGGFQAYQRLRGDGAHLLVVGGHDAAPKGTDAGVGEARMWLDHYVRGVRNGVTGHPRVQLLMSVGDREDYVAGRYVRRTASDWPVPGTNWVPLAFSAARSGSATSANDGSLVTAMPPTATTQAYAAVPSASTATDPANVAIVGASGPDALFAAVPPLTQMAAADAAGLTYTTRPLAETVDSAGPLSVQLRLASTAPESGIWVVLSDVWPDGSAHPLTAGRLLNSYPNVIRARSLVDRAGNIVQPYGDFSVKSPATPGVARTYHVELWPDGNRFLAGHRIRLTVVGDSAASFPQVPGVNTITVGGASGARLFFPVLPGSRLSFR